MKKIISIFMIFILCFSFAACTAKDKTPSAEPTETTAETTLPPPVIDKIQHSKEFKDENGRVVFTVEVVLPEVIENATESFMEYINGESETYFNEACEYAEKNLENAALFMDSNNSDKPWSKKIDFDITYSSGSYLCLLIKDYFSMLGGENEPALRTDCYDILNERPCSLFDFKLEENSRERTTEIIVESLICPRISAEIFGGEELTEEQKKLIHEIYSPSDFYLTADGIGFYLSRYAVDTNLTGTFTCEYKWNEVAFVLKMK